MDSLYSISLVIMIICAVWLVLIATLPNPLKKKIAYIDLTLTNSDNHSKLDSFDGCDEWYVNNTENIIIVKYDADITDSEKIKELIKK